MFYHLCCKISLPVKQKSKIIFCFMILDAKLWKIKDNQMISFSNTAELPTEQYPGKNWLKKLSHCIHKTY